MGYGPILMLATFHKPLTEPHSRGCELSLILPDPFTTHVPIATFPPLPASNKRHLRVHS